MNGFIPRYLRDPARTGAIAPATRSLASKVAMSIREMHHLHAAAQRAEDPPLGIIELGAGTGALSRAISGLNPILVENDRQWAESLARAFPQLHVRFECATETLRGLTCPIGLVSSIPLINNPQGRLIKKLMAEAYEKGLIRFCVLYTYGLFDPLAQVAFRRASRRHFVVHNIPPASVWVYE